MWGYVKPGLHNGTKMAKIVQVNNRDDTLSNLKAW